MATKLTLTIDKSIIDSAKVYAKENGRSLSEIVGNFLKLVSKDIDKNNGMENNSKHELIKSLRGSLQGPEIGKDDEVLLEMLSKKYEN
jgi:hypothetical protein